ncbi:RDD family protein [Alteromonas lipotrueae]|uniref:RDD family protein n=1 Tax=Alteromonas lipotrueae TaxID=2803814 RepID=UPI001C45D32D|nr:RDD family protein [Alteromonas lipotrueae]
MNSTTSSDTGAEYKKEYEEAYVYAGFGIRFGASIIDTLLLLAITFPLLHLIYGNGYWTAEDSVVGIVDVLISYVLPLIATILFWVYKSATPGKMVLNVKVVHAKTGSAPTIRQSIIRYIGYYVSIFPLGLGFLWVLWDTKKQGWHDKMAGTVVIRPKNKGVEPVSFDEK